MRAFISLDGPDGGGHSEHARILVENLCARGYAALLWRHRPHPAGASGARRVEHYISNRLELLRDRRSVIWVMDRGPWSGVAHASGVIASGVSPAESGIEDAESECSMLWQGLVLAYIDADDEVLDARLRRRTPPEDPADALVERDAWRALAARHRWTGFDSGREKDAVSRSVLEWAVCRLLVNGVF